MGWVVELLDELARQPLLGYAADQPTATEPTALSVLALAGHGRLPEADRAVQWLLAEQAADGSLGIRQGEPEPHWPTSLAVLAWNAVLLVGAVPAAVDATACRLMGISPERIAYLRLASTGLGPIDESFIDQRGEPWKPLASHFQLLDKPHLQSLRDDIGPWTS